MTFLPIVERELRVLMGGQLVAAGLVRTLGGFDDEEIGTCCGQNSPLGSDSSISHTAFLRVPLSDRVPGERCDFYSSRPLTIARAVSHHRD